jgi:Holliday junction resolvasome RuvABC endonuclease subunit
MIYIGVDPGMSGAIVVLRDGRASFVKNSETPHDIAHFLRVWLADMDTLGIPYYALIERVNAMPKQGVSSTFKFGQSYGMLRGFLVALSIPFEEVSPVKWQTAMGCRTGGDKNISKARAQQLFPNIKVTHAIADALLIAEHCRRVVGARSNEESRNA